MNNYKKRNYGGSSTGWSKNKATVSSSVSTYDGLDVVYKLTKGNSDTEPSAQEEPSKKQVYSIFAPKKKPSNTSSNKSKSKFEDMYRNAFKGKRNVNLYISGQQVIWEFSFDRTIMAAIKEYVPNRSFDGTIKKWVNPVESLPEAIELYEFMGRSPDEELLERSNQVTQARKTAVDPREVITLMVRPEDTATNATWPFGSVHVQFLFDAKIVSSIKLLPPSQRQFDPMTKHWPIDLLALPYLLEVLLPLEYRPSKELSALCGKCKEISGIINTQASNAYAEDNDENRDGDDSGSSGEQDSDITTQAKLSINRDNCGYSKRPKLTVAQEVWSLKKKEGTMLEDEFDYDILASRVLSRRAKAEGCDCGEPWRLSGGKHICRFFGTFDCDNCGHSWTSAYTWKGERQACRRCEEESYPAKTERLQSGIGTNGGGLGQHDSSRCSRCQKLGYNCSGY
ncbi:expressed unknown protein [Seminavis robusta]|uniref:3CxxC-type domain-containing protein n=1 Tax=Seminavis robusta TaxID=568900 RepID=A0A9N8DHR2_9STRA|nr:expressed unknown protein [Seminavis robusta]|eukprot:Sro94_g048780.1 n/a (453) ;mRNA; f:3842-5293